MINISNKKFLRKDGGQVMLVSVVYFLVISMTIISGFVSPSVREVKNSTVNLSSKSSYYLAESGSEDAVYRLSRFHAIDSTEVIRIGTNTATTTITDNPTANFLKQIVSLGDQNSYQRKITSTLSWAVVVPFYYGVQVGSGGVDLQSSTIVGNIYANGPITGDSSSAITGTAISASSAAVYVDEQNGAGVPTYNRDAGSSNGMQDIAQGFMLNTSAPINKVQLYIKKVGTPPDATVKIVNNVAGSPGTTVYASGTLSGVAVATAAYAWVDVVLTTNPTLSVGTPYFLVLDVPTTSATRYYVVGASLDSGPTAFADGIGLTGQFGGAWTNPYVVSYDHFFKIYLGGVTGSIAGSSGSQWNPLHVGTVSGTAQANTVNYTNSTGTIYCQSGTGNNLPCTYQADPPTLSYPIPDATITQWQNIAANAGNIGSYNLPSGSATLGPTKITGNLTVGGGAILTVAGTLWVTGNISLTGGSQIRLSSSYGAADGVIVSDGTVTIGGGSTATGSGTSGSYLMLLTTSSSGSAVSLSGGSGAVILYAPNGTVNISGGASLQEATANRMVISGGSTVTYNTGLQNMNFSSGSMAQLVAPHVSTWQESQ